MANIILENLSKINIDRQKMIQNGFSAQKYDDVMRGKSNYKLKEIIEISEKFQLSLDYLVYGNEKSLSSYLSEDRQRLLEMYDLLSEMEKGEILGELKLMTRGRSAQEDAG